MKKLLSFAFIILSFSLASVAFANSAKLTCKDLHGVWQGSMHYWKSVKLQMGPGYPNPINPAQLSFVSQCGTHSSQCVSVKDRSYAPNVSCTPNANGTVSAYFYSTDAAGYTKIHVTMLDQHHLKLNAVVQFYDYMPFVGTLTR